MVEITADFAHAHIMTHGLLLEGNKGFELVDAGLGTLIFSIDGVSQDVYEIYRVGGAQMWLGKIWREWPTMCKSIKLTVI